MRLNKTISYGVFTTSILLLLAAVSYVFFQTEHQLRQLRQSNEWHTDFHKVFDEAGFVKNAVKETEIALYLHVHYNSNGSFQDIAKALDELIKRTRVLHEGIGVEDSVFQLSIQVLSLTEQLKIALPSLDPVVALPTEQARIKQLESSEFYTGLMTLNSNVDQLLKQKEQQGHLYQSHSLETLRSNGVYLRWVSGSLAVLLLIAWLASLWHIRYRNKQDRALRDHEQKLNAYFNSVTEGIFLLNTNLTISDFNQALERLILQSKGRLPQRGDRIDQFLTFETIPEFRAALENALKGIQTSVEVHLNFGGESVWAMVLTTPVFNNHKIVSQIIISIDDVNLLVEAQSKLQEQEARFQTIISQQTAGIIIINQQLQIQYANDAALELMDMSIDQLYNRHGNEIPDIRTFSEDGSPLPISQDSLNSWTELAANKRSRVVGYQRRADAELRWFLVSAAQIVNPDSRIAEYIFSFTDYTPFKRESDALKETEQLLAATFKSSPVPIIITEYQTQIIRDVNQHFLELTQFSREDLIGHLPAEVPGFVQRNKLNQFAVELERNGLIQGYETQLWRKDGTTVDALVSSAIIHLNKKPHVLSYIFDYSSRKRMENELRNSEAKFYSIFHHSPVALVLTDIEGTIQDVNQSLIQAGGYSREALVGKKAVDLGLYVSISDREKLLTDVLEHGTAPYREIPFRIANGEIREAIISCTMLHVNQEKFLLSFIMDVSRLREVESKLRMNEQTYRALASNVPGVVFRFHLSKDKPFYFSYLSEKLNTLYGRNLPLDCTQAQLLQCVPENEQERFLNSLGDAFADQKPWSYDGHMLCGDGSLRWIAGRATPSIYGEELIYSGILIDIHDHKLIQEEMVTVNENLKAKAEELEASNKELERFAYVASHDLQEPLRMVSSFVKLLEKKYADTLDDTGKEYIHYAVDGALRMKQLIDDLLQYARVGTNQDQQEDIDLNEVLTEITNLFPPFHTGKALLEWKPLPLVWGRRFQIAQLLQNLVGNAIKYNQQVPARVNVWAEENDQFHLIHVKDNGIGIEPADQQRIFDVFTRLHGSGSTYTGSGIGLSICKKIAEKHGGRIWVSSQPGQGSTFSFSLPKHDSTGR